MIKILVLDVPMLSNTGYWRLFRPLSLMCDLYPGVFDVQFKFKDLTFADIQFADVIITRRPWGQNAGVLVELLQTARRPSINKPVIFDEDDAVMLCPETHELYADFAKAETRKQYVDAINCASIFWFSTPAFMNTMGQFMTRPDVPAMIIQNAVLPSDLPDEPSPDRGLFGWQGKSIQAHDLNDGWDWYEANKNHPLIKQWIFFGWKPPLRHGPNADGPPVPYMNDVYAFVDSFKKNEATGMLGINALWKPLMEHTFNYHKSNINWLVATIGGGYCITNFAGKLGWEFASSEVLPYQEACELFEASKREIIENYNLEKTARMRAESIFALLPHFFPKNIGVK